MNGTTAVDVTLESDVGGVRGVGERVRAHLGEMGIRTVEDLLYHFPRRYLDRSKLVRMVDVRLGEETTVVGKVEDVREARLSGRRTMLHVGISDGSSRIYGVWFNQPYHANRLRRGTTAAFSGKAEFRYGNFQMVNPAYDVLEDEGEGVAPIHTGRIIPLHPASANLSAARLRRLIWNALEALPSLPDPIPAALLRRHRLPGRTEALREMHFPSDRAKLARARNRLVYEELVVIETGLALEKRHRERDSVGIRHPRPGPLVRRFLEELPFQLTAGQRTAFREIAADMRAGHPMNRLLQGEVGSGKTLVALLALLLAMEGGRQGALMAPTEVLAEQHHRTLSRFLTCLPEVRVELLTGGLTAAERHEALSRAESGEAHIVVGTHALIQREVSFRALGLAVVDEQHRFGVHQRMLLKEKGETPDMLIMTATPIPRTLSLTLYGDLEISTLTEMPPGRGEVVTHVGDSRHRERAYALMRREMAAGRQVFVVCPLVESSPRLEAKAAEEEVHVLREVFPDTDIGLVHGQMAKEQKDAAMREFREGNTSMLVATTVIEVGIDIPNASVMLVENADRFGLSQLHQLRGRIGRGAHRSHAIFLFAGDTPEAKERKRAIAAHRDGFGLAEADLRQRGEGQLFGVRQSGMPDLRISKLLRDKKILETAREDAFAVVDGDPHLEKSEHVALREEVRRRFTGATQLEWLFSA